MEKIDKILELLEKKSLTESEKKKLEDFADSDSEIREFIRMYRSLNNSLSDSGHIHSDSLSSLVLYEMGEENDNKLISIIKNRIKSHLNQCSVCQDEYKLFLDEYNDIKEHVGKSIQQDAKSSFDQNKVSSGFLLSKMTSFKYAFAALSIIIIGYIGLFFVSSSITPDYKTNIFPDYQNDFYTTRGRTSESFQQGLNAIEKGNFNKAIEYLEKDIEEHQNEKSIFYTYYIKGITYLKMAESDFIGLFRSYDEAKVNLAISNLQESIDKNTSGDYENLKLDAYYYIGRAHLLNDKKESARENLEIVIKGKGKFAREAANLLSQLENN